MAFNPQQPAPGPQDLFSVLFQAGERQGSQGLPQNENMDNVLQSLLGKTDTVNPLLEQFFLQQLQEQFGEQQPQEQGTLGQQPQFGQQPGLGEDDTLSALLSNPELLQMLQQGGGQF